MEKDLEELEALADVLYEGEELAEGEYDEEYDEEWEEEDEGEANGSAGNAGVDDHPKKSGLLVVNQILPDGPATDLLDVGDILLAVRTSSAGDDEFVDYTTFVELEAALDSSVGGTVEFMVERGGA